MLTEQYSTVQYNAVQHSTCFMLVRCFLVSMGCFGLSFLVVFQMCVVYIVVCVVVCMTVMLCQYLSVLLWCLMFVVLFSMICVSSVVSYVFCFYDVSGVYYIMSMNPP